MAQPELVKDIEARVKKSGDTMTGSLTVNYSWPTISLLDPNNSKAIFQVNPEANNVYLGMSNSGIIVGPSDLKYLDSNSVYQNIYHTGNKPTPAEIGAYSKTETNTLLAEKIPYNGETIDPIDFNSIPLNTIRSVSFDPGTDQTNYHTPLGSSTSVTWYIVETYGHGNRSVQIASLPFSHNRKIYIRYKHDNTWSSWHQLATTDYAVSKAGDTMTGALNFANNTWNKIGDDVQIGDANVAGTLCIQGLSGTTALEFRKYNDLANFGRLSYDGNNFIFERNVYINGSGNITGNLKLDGSITNLAINGGIYWNPYVESASDPTDAASITVIRSGVAGGTELRISQANDANDIVNISVPTNDAARVNNNIILHTGNIQSLGFSRIATGSYTGTGTYGKNSPNTLNLGVVPKLVLVMSTTETRFTTGDSAGYANYGIFDPNITQMGAVRGSIHVSFSGTTLSWYVDVHRNYYPETQQLNKSGVVYKWYALY